MLNCSSESLYFGAGQLLSLQKTRIKIIFWTLHPRSYYINLFWICSINNRLLNREFQPCTKSGNSLNDCFFYPEILPINIEINKIIIYIYVYEALFGIVSGVGVPYLSLEIFNLF